MFEIKCSIRKLSDSASMCRHTDPSDEDTAYNGLTTSIQMANAIDSQVTYGHMQEANL